ncbi:MAG: hypothetical protein ACM3SV_14380 [Betaproteobacteria bacterium]
MIFSTSLALAAARGQILIASDSEFTAANGVANPNAAGTASDPYYIQDWSIDMTGSSFPVCVLIQGTTKYFVVRRNSCVNATVGIAFNQVANGSVSRNNISKLRGGGWGFPAIGVYAYMSDAATIADNTIFDVDGKLSSFSAFGIYLQGTSNTQVLRNGISQLYGARGAAGPVGTAEAPAGGFGGDGGSAVGIRVESVNGGENNVLIQGNNVNLLYGAFGGDGGSGAAGANGGDGGFGGAAHAVFVRNMTNVRAVSNTASSLFASNGGSGGMGGANGGKGGKGGKGGHGEAIYFDTSTNLINNNNNVLTTIAGGNGGRGGIGNGGTGGDGGNGGNGTGIHYFNSSTFSHTGNSITNFRGGTGGTGGTPGGLSGARGITTAILVD